MTTSANIIVTGSIAYDHLLFHPGAFSDLPGVDNKNLNISMVATSMRKEYGGCAGNIAYSLNMLQPGAGVLVGAVGHDIDPYIQWLQQHSISTEHVLQIKDQHTAQAFIATDNGNNQITIFHPGAMDNAHQIDATQFAGAKIAIVSPDGKQAMLDHCRQFHQAKVPLVFDPGQATGIFSGEELMQMIQQSSYVIANEHEWKLLTEISNSDINSIAKMVQAAIITKGDQGARIYFADGKTMAVKAVAVDKAVDPTGCGDSWRSAMLYGLANNMQWQSIANLASLVSSIVVAHNGTQNHSFNKQQIATQYKETFGEELG